MTSKALSKIPNKKSNTKVIIQLFMAKNCLEVHVVQRGAKFLRKRKLQSDNATFAWLKLFNLKLFNLSHLKKINSNTNLNTQISSLRLLVFLYYFKREHVKYYQKWILFALKSCFCSGDYEYFVTLFPLLSTVSRFNGSGQKMNFSNYVLQFNERLV